MIGEVDAHVTQPNDLATEVAFCRAAAVGEFVDREVRQERFWVGRVWIAFLRDFKVAELAEDEFSGADTRAVRGEVRHGSVCAVAGRACLRGVAEMIVFGFAERCVAVC